MLTRHVQRAAKVLGATIAALLFFVGGVALRLTMGPISLGPFAGAIEDSINRSVTGLVVHFDQAVLEWSRAEGKVNLIVLGTKVLDSGGRIVAQAPKADIDLDALQLVRGHLSVKRFGLIGIQLTVARSADGQIRLGFGPDQGSPDLLETIRMVLQDSKQGAGSLQSFSILDARLAFHDEGTGLFVVSPDTDFSFRKNGARLEAALDSAVEIAGAPSRIAVRAVLREDGSPESGTLDVKGLSFPALAKGSASFAYLEPYRLVSDVSAKFALGPNNQVQTVSFTAKSSGDVDAPTLDTPVQVTALELDGQYDATKNELQLGRFAIDSKEIAAGGKANLLFGWTDGAFASVSGSVDAQDVAIDLPKVFPQKLRLSSVVLKASYDRAAKTLAWEQGDLDGGPLSLDTSGSVTFADGMSPAVKLTGTLNAMPVADLLKYWPVGAASGAHDWIASNVKAGRIGPVRVRTDFAAGALDADILPDDALNVSFALDGVTALYIDTMTPLSNGRGSATLTGDNFHVTVDSAAVGPLTVTNGDFTITGLHIRGAPGRIRAHAEGKMPDVMALIDQPPLGYAKRFNIAPSSVSGTAAVDLDFGLPMLRDLPIEMLRIGVQAKLAELSVPVDPKRKLEHAVVTLSLDTKSLTSQGAGTLNGVPVTFKWTEDFTSPGITTRIDITARLDDTSRPALGLAEPAWLTGPMPTTAVFTGRRFKLSDATVRADLTSAKAAFPVINFEKRVGQLVNATAQVHFAEDGSIALSNLAISGEDLQARGSVQLDAQSRLSNVSLTAMRSGKDNDFALNIAPLPGGGYAYKLKGKSLDATRLVVGDKNKAPNGPPEDEAPMTDPIAVDLDMERVLVRDDMALKNVVLSFAYGANEHLSAFNLDAAGPFKGKITGRFSTVKGIRHVDVEADDANGFIRAFTGFTSIRGGSFAANISFPHDDPKSKEPPMDYMGTVTMKNFTVTDQPFLARLFAAGSLDGPLRLMQGDGIAITQFTGPFFMRGKMVTIREGRAGGPAMGGTFEGTYDRRLQRIDVAGSMVPAYGLNSMLGAVPVLGDLLVSKQGEGVFGLTYAMKGNIGEPSLNVNPLSVLTPGILRRIFEFATPQDKTPQVSAAPQPAPQTVPQAE